jgi:hypothetical protein
MYKIKKYSFEQANKNNVIIKPSNRKDKKLDVYDKNNNYLVSVGNKNYKDYPTYLQENKQLAEQRRKLYHARHKNNKGLAGFYASKLLW